MSCNCNREDRCESVDVLKEKCLKEKCALLKCMTDSDSDNNSNNNCCHRCCHRHCCRCNNNCNQNRPVKCAAEKRALDRCLAGTTDNNCKCCCCRCRNSRGNTTTWGR